MLPIYVDLDDVIADTTRPCIELIGRMFGRYVPYEQVNSFSFMEVFDLSSEQFKAFMEKVHEPDILLDFDIIPGAVSVLSRWAKQGFEIAVVTGRPPVSYDASLQWLKKNKIPFNSFFLVDKYGRNDPNGHEALTMEQLTEMPFCMAIEDSLEMAQHISGTMKRPVALMDRPWNRATEMNGNMTRYKNWQEIEKDIPDPSVFFEKI